MQSCARTPGGSWSSAILWRLRGPAAAPAGADPAAPQRGLGWEQSPGRVLREVWGFWALSGLAVTRAQSRDCSCCSSVISLCELPHCALQTPWHQGCGQAGTALAAQNLPEIPSWGEMNILS